MRILVGLIEHLGDIIACEPVSRYLRVNHPAAHLAWAVSPAYRELIDTNPHIDETLPLECLTDWIKLTKHSSYDKVVDLHVNYRVCQHCGIPLVKERGNPFVNVYEWFDYGTLQEAFALGAGLPALSGQPNVYLNPEHRKAVDAIGLPDEYCVVHRESNDAVKDWTDEGWRALAKWIGEELGLHIVEVGAGPLRNKFHAERHLNLVNRLPILQTAEVIRRARFFVGVDSGPAHMANALQVPGIVLLGRLAYFRQYMPFNGFFASSSPLVKILRNLTGPVRSLSIAEVVEAVDYVSAASIARRDEAPIDAAVKPARIPAPPYDPSHEEERRRILGSNLFDPGWYCVKYPDAHAVGIDPLDHFLAVGSPEGRSPGPQFDASRYLRNNEDVARVSRDAFLHYVHSGRKEGRERFAEIEAPSAWLEEARTSRGVKNGSSSNVLEQAVALSARTDGYYKPSNDAEYPRVFAFYLPQFHPIAENNWAHGQGFTEWHSVVKAKPLFRGHYQPRIPGELGFYDLRSSDVLREQLRLAREYGITGFCFYYYYFQGRTLLYQPIKNYLESDLDAPFFILWANENWSKRWDGGDQEVIIEQKHSNQDDLAFISAVLPLFQDPRYLKVEGKPVLLIYKPHLFPDILSSTERWREEIERRGFPGLYLVMVDDWFPNPAHPRERGFDASYEIPSNCVPGQVLSTETDTLDLTEGFTGSIVDYHKFASFHLSRPLPEYKRFRTVMLPWDNTARYGSRAVIHINGHGDDYRLWLMQALLDTYRRYPSPERLVFLHSWNEWCEGTYLEPDGRFGRMFLEQTGEAIRTVRKAVDLMVGFPQAVPTMAALLKLMNAKDEGAFRVMQATRSQTAYVWRELLETRKEVANLHAILADLRQSLARSQADRDAICASRSWRITSPLRSIAIKLRRQH